MLHLVALLVARLPRAALAPFGALLGFLVGSVLRIRRSLVEEAMERAGVAQPNQAPNRAVNDVYRELGRGLVELLWTAGARRDARAAVLARVVVDDEAASALDEALSLGPVVLFASHTGNWELAAAAAARLLLSRGRRLAIVAKPIRDRGVHRFVARLRAELGLVVLPPEGALAAAQRVLAAGDVVAMPIDQVPERVSHGSVIPFLGARAFVDRAPAVAACRARATVLVVAAERAGETHRVRLLATIPPPRPSDGPARRWVDGALVTSTAALDAFVRRRPDAWFWLHRRWRLPREREPRPARAPRVIVRRFADSPRAV